MYDIGSIPSEVWTVNTDRIWPSPEPEPPPESEPIFEEM